MVLVLADRATLTFGQQEPAQVQVQMPVPVMVEESSEGKRDVVEKKTGVKRTGVYFVCLFEQQGQQLQMTRPESNEHVNTER